MKGTNSLFFSSTVKAHGINSRLTSETRTYTPSEILDLSRISLVNRCVRVFCDLKANNFFALQYHPNTSMHMYPLEMKSILKNDMKLFLDENLNFKNFYDIELKFRDRIYYVHKFVILSRCPKMFSKKELINMQRIDLDQTISSKFPNNALEIILNFIYTNECCKEIIKKVLKACRILTEASFAKFLTDFKETFVDKFGFVEYKNSFEANSKLVKEIRINCQESNDDKLESMSQFLLKIFDLKNHKSSLKRKQFKFSRDSHPELHDCIINLNNEQTIACHKCILVARSDFFRNMLLGSWLESNSAEINLPFDLDLMRIYIDYLYSDEILMDFVHAGANYVTSLKSKSEKEIELLFNLYVLSDQLLTDRLKNLCEFKLANLVNLKNVAEIFEFSQEYKAKQLRDFCMEFMSLNLVTLLESKQLENVNVDRLAELSDFYKSYFDNVGSRRITPYADGLRPQEIELVPQELVFDQKFVDGTIDEHEDSWIKQKKVSVTRSEGKKETEQAVSPLQSPTVQLGQIVDQENTNEDKLKWEKASRNKIKCMKCDYESSLSIDIKNNFHVVFRHLNARFPNCLQACLEQVGCEISFDLLRPLIKRIKCYEKLHKQLQPCILLEEFNLFSCLKVTSLKSSQSQDFDLN
ncbi:inhibitor of Bruton tyrosine kinase isoform X1 [Brachionus plicatilis]|uniref:Inhibitor of Bruton tyrosine kinase isoform X1 n=1 Tax=Brachionus plicatilis TaxID=10195 RepID=A0A3M7TBY6_BRAPC|nr:inhibitor of Bruton tyrosine kinase isoform X1 [Brachionus plicatilis]